MNIIAYRILWNLQSYIENKLSFVLQYSLKHHRHNLYDISAIYYKVFMHIYIYINIYVNKTHKCENKQYVYLRNLLMAK